MTRALSVDDIPVIDIGPLIDGSGIAAVGDALVWAATEVGFIYVENHGVADGLIEDARCAGFEFFHLPLEQKLEVASNTHHHGYLRPGSTKMDDDAQIDLKESFNWGVELPGQVPADASPNPLIGPNRWPASSPTFKSRLYPFFDAASEVAVALLRGFATGAGLHPELFVAHRERPVSRGSLQYYPPQPDDASVEQFGVAPHTDFGVLTVLCQDAVGGLELQLPSGDWAQVPPIPGTFVVNVGDLLCRWSNERFRSTPHRVINRSGRERLSLVLAYDPDFETLIDASEFCAPGAAPLHPPITCGDYLMWRFDKAFSYRRAGA